MPHDFLGRLLDGVHRVRRLQLLADEIAARVDNNEGTIGVEVTRDLVEQGNDRPEDGACLLADLPPVGIGRLRGGCRRGSPLLGSSRGSRSGALLRHAGKRGQLRGTGLGSRGARCLRNRMLRHGSEGNSFDPIVITGKKTSMPHGVPGDALIAEGDFVTMDFGCIKHGYCSDMTRTVAVGHATEEMRNIYSIVLEAQLAGIAAARAGVPGRDIDGAARDVITHAGYGEYFGHGFGHSLGLDIHESPNANLRGETPMPVGAVVSAEPGIYLPGRFGVRIEDVMVLRENGAEVITRAPKMELIVLNNN